MSCYEWSRSRPGANSISSSMPSANQTASICIFQVPEGSSASCTKHNNSQGNLRALSPHPSSLLVPFLACVRGKASMTYLGAGTCAPTSTMQHSNQRVSSLPPGQHTMAYPLANRL